MEASYRIHRRADGLADVWLTPGKAMPVWPDGRMDFVFQVLAVEGIDPEDPQWGGNLEEHIRRHYTDWVKSAEVIEI